MSKKVTIIHLVPQGRNMNNPVQAAGAVRG